MAQRQAGNPGRHAQAQGEPEFRLQPGERIPEVEKEGLKRYRTRGVLKDVPPLVKLKPANVITPDPSLEHANQVLFMLSLAEHDGEVHAIARGIGSTEAGKYASRLLHGVMQKDHTFKFDQKPILDDQSREDPRVTRIGDTYYLTSTIANPGTPPTVGLASTKDFQTYADHGIIIPNMGQLDCKDPILYPDTTNGLHMQIRIKPGIQLIRFDSINDLLELGASPEKMQAYWEKTMADYRQNPEQYDILTPNTPEMQALEEKWRPALDHLADDKLLPNHPHSQHLQRHPLRGQTWYGPGPAPIKTTAGWLEFPHRGEVIAAYTYEQRQRMEKAGIRVDDIKLYAIFPILRDLQNPRKIIAAGPDFISRPDPGNLTETKTLTEPLTVPYVRITSGALKTTIDGEPHILLAVGVNDKYTRLEAIPLDKLLTQMLTHGRTK
ncbi:MAG: hypothetical protein PHG85_06440 [Candidatus Altiarchaeota archaeon]|nr:hypothetical protein [Candidatus Altiarchaeota archaeon]